MTRQPEHGGGRALILRSKLPSRPLTLEEAHALFRASRAGQDDDADESSETQAGDDDE